ncbi:MAG: class I SAM-dependent methyltransferase [Bacteroidota bacterium]
MSHKEVEREHYNKVIEKCASISSKEKQSFSSINDKIVRKAHEYYVSQIKQLLDNKTGLHILDFGCGTGVHHYFVEDYPIKLIGIDIAEKAIELARLHAHKLNLPAEYIVMDCEDTSFENDTFDLILDYGAFSSLDISKAFPEIIRILKPSGKLISIETLGHNPITNLKRKINVYKNKRTLWASSHIMKMKDWKNFSCQFQSYKVQYFGLSTLLVLPILLMCKGKLANFILKTHERIDRYLFKCKLLQKYAFKTVFILENPLKTNSNETNL